MMFRVKEKAYEFAPQLLGVAALILWTCTTLLDSGYWSSSHRFTWLPLEIITILGSVLCGVLLRRLNRGIKTDVTTGLHNRRFFYEKLSEEIDRVGRSNMPLSLIMIDIDNFKMVNDKYGHVEGDKVLIEVAKILQSRSRKIDTVVRWGGEEFSIILPVTDSAGAAIYTERLRVAVEQLSQSAGWVVGKVTISAGVATIDKAIDLDKFVIMADDSLYKAKQTRNTIVISKSA